MARVRPHFKVHCSLKIHPKTEAVWRDNDLLATWVRLGVLAVERFAAKTGDSFIVSDRELMEITGKGRLDVARTWLSRLADVSPTSAARDGDVWRISFPNFAKKQGFAQRMSKELHASETLRSETLRSEKKKEKKRAAPSRSQKPAAEQSDGMEQELPSGDVDRLLPLLMARDKHGALKLAGEADEKRAWLTSELAVMEAEVAQGAPWATIVRRWYNAYLRRGDRAFRGIAAREAQEARDAAIIKKLRLDEPQDPIDLDPALEAKLERLMGPLRSH